MAEPPSYLSNYEAVLTAFGYWPSFHDSPVLAFERTNEAISLTLQVWEMTRETDARGFFILRKHHLVRFEFHGITQTNLEQFLPGNILFGLGFSPRSDFDASGDFKVELDSAMGDDVGGSFSARSGKVAAALPCDEEGRLA